MPTTAVEDRFDHDAFIVRVLPLELGRSSQAQEDRTPRDRPFANRHHTALTCTLSAFRPRRGVLSTWPLLTGLEPSTCPLSRSAAGGFALKVGSCARCNTFAPRMDGTGWSHAHSLESPPYLSKPEGYEHISWTPLGRLSIRCSHDTDDVHSAGEAWPWTVQQSSPHRGRTPP